MTKKSPPRSLPSRTRRIRELPGFIKATRTFLVTQAMTAYLQKQGGGDDLFNLVRNRVYKPIHWSKGR